MHFANLTPTSATGVLESNSFIPFVNNIEAVAENIHITVKGMKLVVEDTVKSDDGELFTVSPNAWVKGTNPLYRDFHTYKTKEGVYNPIKGKKLGLSIPFDAIIDKEDNPLIVVLCTEIEVFEGVPADVMYYPLRNGMMLVCLIYGACAFNGTVLQRGISKDVSEKKSIKMDTNTIEIYAPCKDRESGYCYSGDAIVHLIFRVSNDNGVSCRNIQEDSQFLTTRGIEDAREIARRLKEEKERKMRELQQKRIQEAELAKQKQKELEEAEIKKEFQESSYGAAAFLAAVASRR